MKVNGQESEKVVINIGIFSRELLENIHRNVEENKRKASQKGDKSA